MDTEITPSPVTTRAALLSQIETAHDAFLAAVNAYSEQEFTSVDVGGGSTPCTLLAHVTRWENICAHYLRFVLAREPIPLLDGTSEELNARNRAADASLTPEQVWENSDQSYAAVMAMVESLDDARLSEEWRGPWLELQDHTYTLDQVIGIDTFDHYPDHTRALDRWRAEHPRT